MLYILVANAKRIYHGPERECLFEVVMERPESLPLLVLTDGAHIIVRLRASFSEVSEIEMRQSSTRQSVKKNIRNAYCPSEPRNGPRHERIVVEITSKALPELRMTLLRVEDIRLRTELCCRPTSITSATKQ